MTNRLTIVQKIKIMKTTKTTKQTKKTMKPKYTVNLTNVEYIDDVTLAFAVAKFDAKEPLSKADLEAFQLDAATETIIAVTDVLSSILPVLVNECAKHNCEGKKKNIFVRFWNWLFGKK